MIELIVLKTDSTEDKLFLKLFSRGRHADVAYYFSVDHYNQKQGWVMFTRLDCAPTPSFRVGVAGNKIIISKKDLQRVSSWLTGWDISFEAGQEEEFETAEAAQAFLAELRGEVPTRS